MGKGRPPPPPTPGRIHKGPFHFPFAQDVRWVPLSPCRPPRGDRGRGLRHYTAVRGTLARRGARGAGDRNGNGGGDGDGDGGPTAYEVRVGDVALLRPSDNERRPYVGVVLAIHDSTTAAGSGVALDVRWLYRPEDMEGAPPVPAGEDELYESDHVDPDQDADSLVGKATVSSYAVYCRRRQPGGMGGATTGLRAAAAAAAGAGGASDEGGGDGSGVDSAGSLVGDNYATASTHYYVRYFYDQATHRCTPSTLNDPTAGLDDDDDEEEGGRGARPRGGGGAPGRRPPLPRARR